MIDYKKCVMNVYEMENRTDLKEVIKQIFEVVDDLKDY